MGRTLSSNLTTILSLPERQIDYFAKITFPTEMTLYLATNSLTISSQAYSNYIENATEIKQTIENPTDRVTLAIQNKDRVLGLHLAAEWREWQRAEAIISRQYRGGGLTENIEMFGGVVQQPLANDFQLTFTVISDIIAKGNIITNRTLANPCAFIFKAPKTCGYSGGETACNHLLKSKDGCLGRANTNRCGAWVYPDSPQPSAPSSNDPIDPIDPVDPCPRLDQYVLIVRSDGQIDTTLAAFIVGGDFLYNPVTNKVAQVKSATVVKNTPTLHIQTENGCESFNSENHRIILHPFDVTGTSAKLLKRGDTILTGRVSERACERRGEGEKGRRTVIEQSRICFIEYVAPSDVMKIELDGETMQDHIYASGESSERFIVAHNVKPIQG